MKSLEGDCKMRSSAESRAWASFIVAIALPIGFLPRFLTDGRPHTLVQCQIALSSRRCELHPLTDCSRAIRSPLCLLSSMLDCVSSRMCSSHPTSAPWRQTNAVGRRLNWNTSRCLVALLGVWKSE
jgi:hypothetical protein